VARCALPLRDAPRQLRSENGEPRRKRERERERAELRRAGVLAFLVIEGWAWYFQV
jgi:hypothetical protein